MILLDTVEAVKVVVGNLPEKDNTGNWILFGTALIAFGAVIEILSYRIVRVKMTLDLPFILNRISC